MPKEKQKKNAKPPIPRNSVSCSAGRRTVCFPLVGAHPASNFHYRTLAPFVPGQASLHNNYIKGLGPKVRRQRTAGLWWVDEQGICQL